MRHHGRSRDKISEVNCCGAGRVYPFVSLSAHDTQDRVAMSLLAGLKFVKKVPPSSLPPPAASEKGGGERDNEKRKSSSSSKKHHHKKDKKDKGRSSSSRKKSKDAIADANEPASKRQKSHKNSSASGASAAAASESGDVDWLDQAFNFGADGGKGGGDSDSLTPEEITQRKREEVRY